MHISLNWGCLVDTVHAVGERGDTTDVEVETRMVGGTIITDEAALGFSCAGSGDAPGHPQVLGNWRHPKVTHCPA